MNVENQIQFTSDEMREEIKRRFEIAREALFMVRLDTSLRHDGKLSNSTIEKVDEAFNLLS